ncbi:alpha/beta fold hydrolase [Congregibacter sp.]|uniref:alpha/beta fold hydrolase n=1 Tax=Congregibacter sp. TaxID=2744308 RepID=UPI003F6AB1B8
MVTNLAANEEQSECEASSAAGLHASVRGEGEPVVLLHGLFGMGSNLGSLARALAPSFEVHQLDLPNHGRSPWQAHSSLDDLADSIAGYIKSEDLGPVTLVGHSLGGKVAMQLALTQPEAVSALVVADIAPVIYPSSHDAVFSALAAVELAKPRSRAEAGDIMGKLLKEPALIPFLSLSLRRNEEGVYVWRFNVRALRENYSAFREPPGGAPCNRPALFVYGLNSSYVDEAGKLAALGLFPAAQFAGIADTGHWLHAEKPVEFNAAVLGFLQHGGIAQRENQQ